MCSVGKLNLIFEPNVLSKPYLTLEPDVLSNSDNGKVPATYRLSQSVFADEFPLQGRDMDHLPSDGRWVWEAPRG